MGHKAMLCKALRQSGHPVGRIWPLSWGHALTEMNAQAMGSVGAARPRSGVSGSITVDTISWELLQMARVLSGGRPDHCGALMCGLAQSLCRPRRTSRLRSYRFVQNVGFAKQTVLELKKLEPGKK